MNFKSSKLKENAMKAVNIAMLVSSLSFVSVTNADDDLNAGIVSKQDCVEVLNYNREVTRPKIDGLLSEHFIAAKEFKQAGGKRGAKSYSTLFSDHFQSADAICVEYAAKSYQIESCDAESKSENEVEYRQEELFELLKDTKDYCQQQVDIVWRNLKRARIVDELNGL